MAKISDLLASGRTYSLEFFPPKHEAGWLSLGRTIAELEHCSPTSSASPTARAAAPARSTADLVTGCARRPASRRWRTSPASGTRAPRSGTCSTDYRSAGIDNILALGGDPPAADGRRGAERLPHAVELIDEVDTFEGFSIGVAAHPEVHPRSPDRESDRRHLAGKLRRADFAITQFFFEAEHYRRIVDELTELGVDKPVVPGIMPITNRAQVQRMADMSGAECRRGSSIGSTRRRRRRRGAPDRRRIGHRAVRPLLEAGAPGLHFYTLNRSTATREIYANLGLPVRA